MACSEQETSEAKEPRVLVCHGSICLIIDRSDYSARLTTERLRIMMRHRSETDRWAKTKCASR